MRANLLLAIFALYGAAIAWAGPRLFAGQIDVAPMRFTATALFATFPLRPTAQNITAAVYLLGTLMCSLGAFVACRNAGGERVLVRLGLVVCFLHIFFGVSGMLLAGTAYTDFLKIFRNGNYSQVDQHIGSISRMNGIFPEPSSFSAYGLVWFVFLFECWFRDVLPRVTGLAAVAMVLTLLFSTSSTAYLGLGLYGALFVARTVAFPVGVSSPKLLWIGVGLLVSAAVVAGLMVALPGLYAQLSGILASMTVNKQDSESALQRTFWARQGLSAFDVSFGLGIGPGSFRSSSQLMAILGSTGLVGIVSFVLYVLAVIKPMSASTYNVVTTPRNSIGTAAGWSAFCMLLAAGFISPTPDPGSDFATLAGASLALRRRTRSALVEWPEDVELRGLPSATALAFTRETARLRRYSRNLAVFGASGRRPTLGQISDRQEIQTP